ncbi:hypothetical protein [Pseudomonas helleri]|uniref:hypothetical protein n=1 Tax=Pseudomonas helleri TaxID=1608996 RepID=UPI00333FA687
MAKEYTGSFQSGLYLLAGLALFAVLLTAIAVSDTGRRRSKTQVGEPAAINH